MKSKYLIGFVGLISVWAVLFSSCFAQTNNCVVVDKRGTTEIVVSCPDGTKTVDAGGRTDLYRVGDRVDIYGVSRNQTAPLPGQTTKIPGR